MAVAIDGAMTTVTQGSAPPASIGVRFALFTIVFFFGGSLPSYKLAEESFGPATVNLIRFVLAAIIWYVIGLLIVLLTVGTLLFFLYLSIIVDAGAILCFSMVMA